MDKINEVAVNDDGIKLYKEKGVTRAPSLSSYNEIYFIVTGEVKFNLANKTQVASSGEVVCIPALKMYGYSSDDAEVWHLVFAERYLADFYDCYNSMILPYFLRDVKFNKKALSILKEELLSLGATELEKRTALNYFFAKSAVRYGVVKKEYESDSQIADIVNFINDNYDKEITLDYLAKEFCISKMVLSRKLSKHLGVDLRRFVSEVRIQAFVKQRREKQNDNVSSVELAYRCGFRSYETFYRTYRRYLGEN